MIGRDDSAFERELTAGLERLAPRPRRELLSRVDAAVAATAQRSSWRSLFMLGRAGIDWSRAAAVAAVAAIAMVTGIAIGSSGLLQTGNRPAPTPSASASAQPGGWVEPAAYSFVMYSRCGERNLIGHFRIAVADGRVTDVTSLDDPPLTWAGIEEDVPTLADMLGLVAEARANGKSTVEVETDPLDGHPTRISIDWRPEAIDDEECYDISDYVVTTAPSPAPSVPFATKYADWARVTLPDPSGDLLGGTTASDVVATGAGYLAVGTVNVSCCADGDPSLDRGIVWTSPDGMGWELHDGISAFAHARLSQVVAVGDRLVAAGTYAEPRAGENATPVSALWTSSDGLSWVRVDGDVPAIIARSRDGLAGVIEEPSGATSDSTVFFATSADGREWHRDSIGWPGVVRDLAARDDGTFVAIGSSRDQGPEEAAVWWSSEAGGWVETTATDAPTARFESIAVLDGTFYIVGNFGAPQPDGSSMGSVWANDDPATGSWLPQAMALSGGERLTGVFALNDALVATGETFEGDLTDAMAWISANDATWRRVPDGGQFAGSDNRIAGLIPASMPGGMLAVGSSYDQAVGHQVPVAWVNRP